MTFLKKMQHRYRISADSKTNKSIKGIKDFLNLVGCETIEEAERAIYKYNDCGPWVKISKEGVKLGSIVEGSDAEVEADMLKFPFSEKDYDDTMKWLEAETSVLWKEANE
jgi:hypothetical protein